MKTLSVKKFQSAGAAKLLEEAKQSLKEDEAVYSYIRDKLHLTHGQVDDNLAVLLDFQEDFHYCDHCPGFEQCDKSQPHYQMSLSFDGKMVLREFTACPKLRAIQDYESRFLRHDFPSDWNDSDLRSIDRGGERTKIITELGKLYNGDSKNWFYLQGGPRSGKSFILAAFANTYAKKNPPVAFCDTATFIEKLKNFAFSKSKDDKDSLNKALQAYCSCPLLILDGFGNEFKSDYVFSSLLYPILSSRKQQGLLTCFASDFSIAEIMDEYKSKIGGLRSKQFANLLKESCGKEYVLSDLKLY